MSLYIDVHSFLLLILFSLILHKTLLKICVAQDATKRTGRFIYDFKQNRPDKEASLSITQTKQKLIKFFNN